MTNGKTVEVNYQEYEENGKTIKRLLGGSCNNPSIHYSYQVGATIEPINGNSTGANSLPDEANIKVLINKLIGKELF